MRPCPVRARAVQALARRLPVRTAVLPYLLVSAALIWLNSSNQCDNIATSRSRRLPCPGSVVVLLDEDVLGNGSRARGLPELYRDRRRRRGAGHRDSQAKILRIAVSARLVTTCRPDQIYAQFHPESQLSTMSCLLDARRTAKAWLWSLRAFDPRFADLLPTIRKAATFQHCRRSSTSRQQHQHHRDRDDDQRDVPEQRYARRAAQAVCRRGLP